MNFPYFSRNQFVQESTFHGVSHLRYSKSKVRCLFWLIITFLSAGYAGFEIIREIKRISSGIEFETTYRLARIDEIHVPTLHYHVINEFDIFDWRLVSETMTKFNWTIEDMGHLLATYPNFRHQYFKSRNVSIRHVQQLGNISLETYKSMYRQICVNGNQIIETRIFLSNRKIKIDCPLYKSSGNKLISRIRAPHDMCDEPYMNIRTGIINFTRQLLGVNLYQECVPYKLFLNQYVQMAPLQMDLINSFSIDPMLVNKPTMKTVNCNKRFCDSQAKEQPCMNYSELLLQERGIDCLQWEYKVNYLPPDFARSLDNLTCDHENMTFMLVYPPFENWQVREHKPLFLWYQTLSNIGGTLSIWTGASVLSFLHLVEVLCCMCYKRKWKNGDNSQIAEPPV